jgi:hypothetical protein
MLRQSNLIPNPTWANAIFDAKAVRRGGVVRRAVRDVEREVGRAAFLAEVQRRGFHAIECGQQFIVICNDGQMKVHC